MNEERRNEKEEKRGGGEIRRDLVRMCKSKWQGRRWAAAAGRPSGAARVNFRRGEPEGAKA